MDSTSATNRYKEIIRRLFEEVWSSGNFEGVKDFIAPQMTFHFRGKTHVQSPDDVIQIVQRWRTAFPDLTFEIGDILVEQDLGAARLTHRGTHQNPWRGIPATGREIEIEEMMFFRFEQGQIVEVWELTDQQSEHQQLVTSDGG